MICAIAVDEHGTVSGGWGRAAIVAVATTQGGVLTAWQQFAVGWDVAHDQGAEGAHHARIARFLIEHQVEVVITQHMGPGMVRMLETMGIRTVVGAGGEARASVLSLA